MQNNTPKIVFIGTGRIANSLAEALRKHGKEVAGIISRKRDTAEQFAARHAITNYSDSFAAFTHEYTHCILAVPDEDINTVALEIANAGVDITGKTFIHLSGSQTVDKLECIEIAGGKTASIHFMMSFPTKVAVPLQGSAAAVESRHDDVFEDLRQLCISLHINPFRIRTEHKVLYHIIGVYLSNFLIDNLYTAERLFAEAGIRDINFYDLSVPILMATLSNVKTVGMPDALSGPAERASTAVIAQHLQKLNELPDKHDIVEDYVAKTKHLLVAARAKNPKLGDKYDELEKMLLP